MNTFAVLVALVAGAAAGVYVGRASCTLRPPVPDLEADPPGLGKSAHALDLVDDDPYYGPVRRVYDSPAYDWEREA